MFSFVLRELSVDMRGLGIDEGGVAASVFQQQGARPPAAAGAVVAAPGNEVAKHVRDLRSSRTRRVQLAAAALARLWRTGALAPWLAYATWSHVTGCVICVRCGHKCVRTIV